MPAQPALLTSMPVVVLKIHQKYNGYSIEKARASAECTRAVGGPPCRRRRPRNVKRSARTSAVRPVMDEVGRG